MLNLAQKKAVSLFCINKWIIDGPCLRQLLHWWMQNSKWSAKVFENPVWLKIYHLEIWSDQIEGLTLGRSTFPVCAGCCVCRLGPVQQRGGLVLTYGICVKSLLNYVFHIFIRQRNWIPFVQYQSIRSENSLMSDRRFLFFFFFLIFLIWTIFTAFIEFFTILVLCFLFFWLFGREACGILAPWPGIEPVLSASEGKVLNHWIAGTYLEFLLVLFLFSLLVL